MTRPAHMFIGLVVLLASTFTAAITLPFPVKLSELQGAWIGPSDSSAYFRIELNKSGRGLLVIQEDSTGGAISLYRIRGTGLVDRNVAFALTPVGNADPTVKVFGTARYGELNLVRSGVNHGQGWRQTVVLEREDRLLSRIRAVQDAAADFHRAER